MFCVKCGAENTDDSKFCRKCGQPLRQSESEPEVVETKPAASPEVSVQAAVQQPVAAVVSEQKPQATSMPAATLQSPLTPVVAPAPAPNDLGIQTNIAGALCYAMGWVTGILFLIIGKGNEFIKFHAWQSIVTFGFLSVISIVFQILSLILRGLPWFIFIIFALFSILVFILWIILMIQAYQSKLFKLPVAGDIAMQLMKK